MNKMETVLNEKPDIELDHTHDEQDSPRISTRATQLAMELSKEKKRLTEELSTLQAEYENLAPTTPTGTVDWYIKWIAVISGVLGVFLISANVGLYGQLCYLIGAIGWTIVGIIWNDKAIIIGSIIPATSVALNITTAIIGV